MGNAVLDGVFRACSGGPLRSASLMLVSLFVAGPPAIAASGEDLQVASQNPVAALISVPFQNNLYFGGDYDEPLYVMNAQPVVPLTLNEDWNFIVRPIVPLISEPGLVPAQSRETGLGDIVLETFLTPTRPFEVGDATVTVGLGPAFTFPTHSRDRLGSRNYSAGPAFVTFVAQGSFTYGLLLINQWSYAGPDDEKATNQMTLQPFINYNLKRGWSLLSAPLASINWNASQDRVTLPIGGGVSKLTQIGGMPIKFGVSTYYNALRPEVGPDWQAQFSIALLFPE